MTIQSIDLVTLDKHDLDTILDALRVANSHYHAMAESMARTRAHAFAKDAKTARREVGALAPMLSAVHPFNSAVAPSQTDTPQNTGNA